MAQAQESFKELKGEEIRSRERELRREIFDLRMKAVSDSGALKRYRAARKDLARLLTHKTAANKAAGA